MRLKLSYGRQQLLSQFPEEAPVKVVQVLQSLKRIHPDIFERLCDKDGQLRSSLAVFVNGHHIRYRQGLETPLSDGDEVYVIPLITGG